MYDYEVPSQPVSEKIKFSRYFHFISLLEKYQDNITINKTLQKYLLGDKISADGYGELNDILDSCIFHLNQALEFNNKHNIKLNHHYIIKSSLFSFSYKIIDEKDFKKCTLFYK